MQESVQFKIIKDSILQIDHQSLPSTPATFLTAAVSAGGTTLTVRDNAGFSNSSGGDLVLIGNFGDERSEIKVINGAVTAGTSLTTTAMTFDHPINTPVRKILFDKIEVYGNSTATSAGSSARTNSPVTIDASSLYTEFVVVDGNEAAFYGVRPIRSVATTYNGSYSDFIAATGFTSGTVGFIIDQAFKATTTDIAQTGKYSKQWAYDQIFLGEQEVSKELKKWSWLQQFEYDAGNVTLGVNHFTLPTDLADRNTPKQIQGLRIGTGNNLSYMTKSEYEYLYQNAATTTVGTTYIAAAATIVLTDSRDFTASGGINVYTGTNTIDSVSYTTNTRSTSTLTGVTSNDNGGTAGEPVWQGEPQGKPSRYTIYEGEVYFDAVPDTTTDLVGTNIWLDYYKTVTRVDSDGDSITVPDPLCIQYWLETQIKRSKNNGNIAADDTSWIGYQRAKKKLLDLETSGQGTYLVPSFYEDITYYGQTY